MARPRNDAEGKAAKERMEDAFWAMLAEMPYQEMTMSRLAKRAGVNHNTFYYHFASLDDMAIELLERNLDEYLPIQIMAGFMQSDFDIAQIFAKPGMGLRFERVCLVAGPHGASWMVESLKAAVVDLWLSMANLKAEDLSEQERMELAFVLGGIISVLGSGLVHSPIGSFAAVAEGPLGHAAFETMQRILEGHASA